MDTWNVGHSCNEIPYGNEKEQTVATWDNLCDLSCPQCTRVTQIYTVGVGTCDSLWGRDGRGDRGSGELVSWLFTWVLRFIELVTIHIHTHICIYTVYVSCLHKKLKTKCYGEQWEKKADNFVLIKTIWTLRKASEVCLWAKNRSISCHGAEEHPLLPFCALVWVPK